MKSRRARVGTSDGFCIAFARRQARIALSRISGERSNWHRQFADGTKNPSAAIDGAGSDGEFAACLR